MSDPFNLQAALEHSLNEAAARIEEMRELGYQMAEAERAYRVAKQQRILFERDRNKTPVTIIQDVVAGYEDIAELKRKRTCAEVDFDANREAILFWKKQTDAIREQIQREWTQAGERSW